MTAYVVRRILQLVPVLIFASIAVWAISYALPGGPAYALAGQFAGREEIAAIELRLGLDRPVWMQYFVWLSHAVRGDFGSSYSSGGPVLDLLLQRIPATAQLAVLSMSIGFIIAIPLGILAAIRPGSLVSRLIRVYQASAVAIPTFWLGLLLIMFFSLKLAWLPSLSDFVPIWSDPVGGLRNTLLPALTIGIYVSGILVRFVTSSMEEALERDFVRTARSKGVPERGVITRHVLRNALLPTVTIAGLQLGAFLGGTVVIEVVFNYPGLGRLVYAAVSMRDYAVIQGAVLFIAFLFLLLNLAVDLLYAILDPRIRLH